MRKTIIGIAASMLMVGFAQAGEPPELFADKSACMEGPMEQFGRYVGDWKIEDESLAKDGSGWGPGNGARLMPARAGPTVTASKQRPGRID